MREKYYGNFINRSIHSQAFLVMKARVVHDDDVALLRFREQKIAKPSLKSFRRCRAGVAVFPQNALVAISRDDIHTGVLLSGHKAVNTLPAQSTGILPEAKPGCAAFIYVNTPRNRDFGYFPLIFFTGGFGTFFIVECLFFRVILSFLRLFLTASPLQ